MKYQDTSSNYETALGEKIMTYDGVAAISFTSDLINQIDNMLRSLDIVIVVADRIGGPAGVCGAVQPEQHQHHRTTERAGNAESARLLRRRGGIVRVPGKHGADTVRRYRGHGNWNVFHHCVIQTVEVDMMMFGRNVFPRSYGWSALITLAFALFVNFMMFYRLRKIDMIESLKSVE